MKSPNFCRLCLQKITGPFKLLNQDFVTSNMLKHLFPGMNVNLMKASKICSECFKYIQFSYTIRETIIKNEQKVNSNMVLISAVEKDTCRLCLDREISESSMFLYETHHQTMPFSEVRSIIEIAIIGMHYDILKKPVVCNSCWQIVRLIYLFKKKCFAIEKVLKFFCRKNNLTSLTHEEIESVSICYNSNLQKFSTGEPHANIANLIPRESINNGSGKLLIENFVKPVDVYFNNFTNDDEDDVFEEEQDDIFIENPTIDKDLSKSEVVSVKEDKIEVCEALVSALRDENEDIHYVDKIKEEEMGSLNINPKDINNEQDDKENTHESEVNGRNSEGGVFRELAASKVRSSELKNKNIGTNIVESTAGEVRQEERNITLINKDDVQGDIKNSQRKGILEESPANEVKEEESSCLNIMCEDKNNHIIQGVEKNSRKTKNGDTNSHDILRKLFSNKTNMAESTKETEFNVKSTGNRGNPTQFPREIECVVNDANKIIENCLEGIELENLEGNSDETENTNAKKCYKKITNPQSMNRFTKYEKNSYEKAENKKKTIKSAARKKKASEQVEDMKDSTNLENNSDNNLNEKFESITKKHKKKSENLDTKMYQNVKINSNEIKKCKDGKKGLKPVFKRIESKDSDDIQWGCNQCQFKTKYKNHLNRHTLIHNKNAQMLTCPLCVTYSTNIQRNLDRHMLKHQSESFRQCVHCIYTTVYKHHMKKHMMIHEKVDNTENPKDLDADAVQPPGALGFRCEECPFETSKEAQIIAHLRAHKSKEKILKCLECHYITTRSHSLKDHMELHNDNFVEKKFKCELCPFKGKRYTHLVSHMLMHKKEFNFSCSQCSYKAKRKGQLVTHMLQHQNDGKKIMFQCPYCKYKSIRKEHLKFHCRNRHQMEVNCIEAQVVVKCDQDGVIKQKKTAICPYCSYRNYIPLVEVHVSTVHFSSDTERMECNDCSYKTNKRNKLLDHIKVHHGRVKKTCL